MGLRTSLILLLLVPFVCYALDVPSPLTLVFSFVGGFDHDYPRSSAGG